MKNWLIILLVFPMLFFSCRKDFDNTTINTTYQAPQVIVTANLSGQVVGPDGQGEPGVMVRVSNLVEITDEFGFYHFKEASLNARGTYVTANKSGFFLGSDRLYPANGSTNFSKIELLPKTLSGSFSGESGGSVGIENSDVKIDFPEDAIVDAQNNLYTGEVLLYGQWLNPVADNIQNIMPGGLFGLNSDSREVMMASLGMIAVELEDPDGNALQLAPGKKATFNMPAIDELEANAPDEVPLWYFDESLGLWIEDGVATHKSNGGYTAEVSHFTFWNVDVPAGVELIFISGCIVTPDGNGIAYKDIQIIAPSNFYTYAYGATDADGHFSGYLPAGDLLTFEVADDCGETFSFDVGPFDADTDLPCFELNSSSLATITGQIVDCDFAGVDGALVVLDWINGSQMATADENGDFSAVLFNCEDVELTVRGIDIANQEQTDEVSLTVEGDEDLGQLQACDNPIAEFLDSNIDGELFTFLTMDLVLNGYDYYIDSFTMVSYHLVRATGNNDSHVFSFAIESLDEGSYTGDELNMQYSIYGATINDYLGFLYCGIPCDDMIVNVTSNGGPGGYLEGNFTGTLDGWSVNQQELVDIPSSGTFRVQIPE